MKCTLLLLVGLVGCTASGRAEADMSDAIARVDPAVVTVRAGRRAGAGFAVNAKGDIVTSAHVVGKAKQANVKFADGRTTRAAIVARESGRDLALLRPSGRVSAWVKLGATEGLKRGHTVAALGAPLGLEHSVTEGVVSAPSRRVGEREYVQIDAALNPGNSGGPVIDSRGAVIGVSTVVARDAENVGFAIPTEVLVGFLQRSGIDYEVIAGDEIGAATEAPAAGDGSALDTGEEPDMNLLLVVGLAVVASVLCSALTSVLVVRAMLSRSSPHVAAPGVAPVAAAQREEDLSDIDITLQ